MVDGNPIKILICIAPGLMRDSICTLLTSFSDVICISASSEFPVFLKEVDQYHPDVILFDYSTNYHNLELIRTIGNHNSDFKYIVITDNLTQHKPKPRDGVEYLLRRGFTGRELKAIIQEIYLRKQFNCTETNSSDSNYRREKG